jgi:hypothetical protein
MKRHEDPDAYADPVVVAVQARPGLRNELLHLLSLSGTMAGLCITGITLFHTMKHASGAGTIADDMLALSALFFLLCTYMIFIALRTRNPAVANRLDKIIDALFSLAMTSMVATGFVMVYTVW